uniref:Uncharacterized protein n=1 Tax=Lactuca sativa TaxID=4236 RepID=A0A9R1WRV8_LACSA|nr:hypothetical protein LSAT_V11C900467550 [Lactuca sativa]
MLGFTSRQNTGALFFFFDGEGQVNSFGNSRWIRGGIRLVKAGDEGFVLMNFQLPRPEEEFDYYANSGQDDETSNNLFSDEEHDSEQSRIKYRIEIALPTVKSRFGHGSVRLSFGSCLCELDDT